MTQDLNGCHTAVRESYSAPLRQSAAGGRCAVAEGGEEGIIEPAPVSVGVEVFVYDAADAVEYLCAGPVVLVEGGGVGDVEIEAAAGVPLCEYPV